MKLQATSVRGLRVAVAPFAGAWIEILHRKCLKGLLAVAPFAGTWIEIQLAIWIRAATNVAPFTGAWIEMLHPGCARLRA